VKDSANLALVHVFRLSAADVRGAPQDLLNVKTRDDCLYTPASTLETTRPSPLKPDAAAPATRSLSS